MHVSSRLQGHGLGLVSASWRRGRAGRQPLQRSSATTQSVCFDMPSARPLSLSASRRLPSPPCAAHQEGRCCVGASTQRRAAAQHAQLVQLSSPRRAPRQLVCDDGPEWHAWGFQYFGQANGSAMKHQRVSTLRASPLGRRGRGASSVPWSTTTYWSRIDRSCTAFQRQFSRRTRT